MSELDMYDEGFIFVGLSLYARRVVKGICIYISTMGLISNIPHVIVSSAC